MYVIFRTPEINSINRSNTRHGSINSFRSLSNSVGFVGSPSMNNPKYAMFAQVEEMRNMMKERMNRMGNIVRDATAI